MHTVHRGKSQAGIEMQRLQLFCKKKKMMRTGAAMVGNTAEEIIIRTKGKLAASQIIWTLEKIFSLTRLKTGQTAENYISNNIF